MSLNSLTNNMSNAPNPSALSSQLPGGLGASASRAHELAGEMQGMPCPDFNPGAPGAAKAEELKLHLNTINDSAATIKNPMANELSQTQAALNKVRSAPSSENIQNYKDKAQTLQQKTQTVYGNAAEQQKAADFGSNAQAKANSEQSIAQQRAAQAATEHASQYRQAADNKSAAMLNKVNSGSATDYQSNAQQAMYNAAQNCKAGNEAQQLSSNTAAQLQKQYPNNPQLISDTRDAIANSGTAKDYVTTAQKAQAAQDAVKQMQNRLPSTPGVTPSVSSANPYVNLNNTVQSLSVPKNCPQLSGLQNQLSSVQAQVSSAMSYNSKAAALQQVQGMQTQMSSLSDTTRAAMGTSLDETADALGSNESAENATTQPGLIVVNGAKGKCSMATAPFDFIAIPEKSEVNGQAAVHPLTVKYSCTGNCMSPTNPITASRTAAAMGTPTYGPCLIAAPSTVIPTAWAPTTAGTKTAGGQPCLVKDSIGACIYTGVLTVTDPGQTDAVAKIGG